MPRPARDAGYTLAEVMVTIVLLGVMMAIAVGSLRAWSIAHEQSGTARSLQTALRQAQQRAVTEGVSVCAMFDVSTGSYTVFRGACDNPAKTVVVGPVKTRSTKVRLSTPVFTGPSGSTSAGVTFTARGSAWPGQVRVLRDNSAKVYVIGVEGLTGRVSLA